MKLLITRQTAIKMAAPLMVGALLLPACSKKDAEAPAASTTAAKSDDTTATTSVGSDGIIPADGVEIDKTVFHGGWAFTVGTLTSTSDEDFAGTEELTFALSIENLGPDTSTPWTTYSLEIGEEDDREAITPSAEDIPEIPGGSKGKGTLAFQLDASQIAKFSLDNATLVLGSSDETQSKMPLGSGGELISLEPQDQDPGLGKITISDWVINPTATVLEWTKPGTYEPAGKDKTFLVVTFDVTAGAVDGDITWTTFKIDLPDGTSVNSDDVTHPKGTTTALAAGETGKGFQVTFTLDSPVDGDYTVTAGGDFLSSGGEVTSDPVTVALKTKTG